MNKKKFFLWILFCCVLNNIYAQKNQKYQISYNFKQGNIYATEIVNNQQIQVMNMDMTQIMIFGADFEVLSTDAEGNGVMKMTYTRVKFEQNNPQLGKIGYDSDSKEEPNAQSKNFAAAFGKIVGKYVTMKMKNTGEIIEILDGDEALKEGFKKDPNFATYPTKKLKIGDSWTTKIEKNISGVIVTTETKNTLKEVKNGQLFLESTAQIKDKNGKKIGNMTTKSVLQQDDIMISTQKTLQDIKNLKTAQAEMDMKSNIEVNIKKK